MAVAALTLAFQPWTAALAGLSLGTLSAGKTLVSGRILGISGAIKGILSGDWSLWRWLFTAGLVGAGAVATQLLPGAFDALPASYTTTRAVIAGLLVGVGTTIGNGCTSGHGIAGNARLSVRSFVFTCTFMATAMAAATLSGTAAALKIPAAAPMYTTPTSAELKQGTLLLGSVVAATIAAVSAASKAASQSGKDTAVRVYELFAGATFGFGLCLSGMTRPTVVASALLVVSPAWNATLFFVMAGALAVALPLFQLVILKRSAAADGSALAIPSNCKIDARLLLGGALFGAGWGIGGVCPGPGIVALASGQQQMVVLVASMLVGMGVAVTMGRAHGKARASKDL